ncbi:T3SS (YopN, CesT) and YbjN peptide-binding chaperone 1 [Gephyromycinifex aptenodytis]|uniref:T3SS (YopN, CesT) and YbjN peptide-binding chaperone 1 n=1 Tax=Gephyromycinifex aptenodytis TaxID=2716227 RepID=UPI00144578B7|nr:hypothetical protein [Gephyromycinifex aptenodytis]
MTDPTSLPSFPPPAGEHPLRGRVIDALSDEGFRPDIDADGDVSYKVEGHQLFVHCAEGEVPVMRVFGQWQIGEDLPTDETLQLRNANDLSLRLNIVKVGVNNGTLVVTAEHIVGPDADVRALIAISTQLVLTAVQFWHQMMLGQDVFGEGAAPQEG